MVLTSSEFKYFSYEHEAGFSEGIPPPVSLVAVVWQVTVIVSLLLLTAITHSINHSEVGVSVFHCLEDQQFTGKWAHTSVWEKKSPGSFSRKEAREKDDFFWIDITFRHRIHHCATYITHQIQLWGWNKTAIPWNKNLRTFITFYMIV